jgi:ElaB/YqjD/DUF883 family membrane-anchored ribosome-binding protein
MSEPDASQLMDDLRSVVSDAEALLKATAGVAGDQVEAARARAEDSLKVARARLGDLEDDVVAKAREAVESTDRYVRESPWAAIGIAAGVAFVVGVLVGRR